MDKGIIRKARLKNEEENMNVFVLNYDSFIDVITNSSSEIFVLNTKKKVEFIREILTDYLELLNKSNKNEYSQNIDNILTIEVSTGNRIPILDELKKYAKDAYYDYKCKKGSIIIQSIDSNSIPYPMMQFIEEIFNADRWHLG